MESARAVRRAPRSANRAFAKQAGLYLAYFGGGLLFSRGAVMGNLAPFGASFAAAVPRRYLLPSLLGSALGYLILNPTDTFRYLAVIVAVGGVRWLFGELRRIAQSRLFAPLAAFVPILATGLALLFGTTGGVDSFVHCLIEAFLAAGAAYFLAVTVRVISENRGVYTLSGQESACLVMSGCLLILAFGSLQIEGVSLGRILAVIAILLCARYGGVSGGAVCSVATGSVFSLSDVNLGFLCGGFAFGGLTAGLFSSVGKLACALAFTVCNFMMGLAFGGSMSAAVLIESAVGSAVFLVLPKEVGSVIRPLFKSERSATLADTLRRSLVMRLGFVSKAIGNVKNDVTKVSEKLDELYSPTFAWVCENVADEVCSGCGLRMYCYEHKGGVTKDDFFRLEEVLAEKKQLTEGDVTAAFYKNCCKKGEIAASMTTNYRNLVAAQEAQRRVSELRGVVAGQFSGVSDILSDLSKEIESVANADEDSAQRITAALHALGAVVEECVCLETNGKRLTVELMLSAKIEPLKRSQIAREVSRCCGRRFDLPSVTREGDRLRIALCELPRFDAEIGSDQHIADHGKLCGDCIDYFTDGTGNLCALVCDGMGTGGRAAVDGNMAVSVMGRLLRSGLSADSALQIVNSALMVKSEDESLSTVDLAQIDLYSGALTLKKAGAAMTFIKRGGRVSRREQRSLPAGILNSIRFATEEIKLNAGDMVVMVSDGVVTGDEKWLEKLIRSWNKGSAQDLAQAVVQEAIRRRENLPDDDITALAIRLTEE